MSGGNKRALFVVDVNGWAWDFMTRGILKNLPEPWVGEQITIGELSGSPIAWWGYDGLWFWNPNLLFTMLMRPGFAEYDDIPDFPNGLDRKKIVAAQNANVIVGYYGSTRTKERIKWTTSVGVKAQAFICKKYLDIAKETCPEAKDRFHVVHPAVDNDIFYPKPIEHAGFIVGWAGHAGWEFKRTYLLDRIKFAIKMKSDWGPEYFYKDRPFDHMAEFYNMCDAYICVSKQEGIPQPILEAAACGLPILSTDVGGISDFLDPEYLCPVNPEDDVVKFMNDKLAVWEKNPELRKQIGEKNRQKVLEYWNWKARAKQIVKIWEDM